MIQVRQLFDLQELDLAITLHQTEIQKIEGQLTETEEFLNARKELAEKANLLKEKQKTQHNLENEVEDLRAKMNPIYKKLHSGSIKNPKELMNLQADYNQQKSVVDQKEDALLEMMVETDKLQEETNLKHKELQQIEKSWEESQAKLRNQLEDEKVILAELEQKKQALTNKLDPTSVKLYNSLKARKNRPLAKVEQGMCQGCRVTLPMSLIQRARASSEPVFCCNCERILLVG